ncbi:MAG: class I SAM-dependent methyltransferase [Paracoccaceae bacterium]
MWEERYQGSDGYLFGTEPAQFLTENPWIVTPGGTALCVADGEGRNAVGLARAGMRVSAFDMAPTAVERARALAQGAGVSVDATVAGWDDWDWSRRFDMVVGIFIQFAPPAFRARQFADMAAAVAPGGRIVLHGYTPEQVALGTGGPRAVENMYTPALLREAFAGWQVERLATYERDVQEGRGHSGRSALIDFVARKA